MNTEIPSKDSGKLLPESTHKPVLSNSSSELHAALMLAHQKNNLSELASLYQKVAQRAEEEGAIGAARFYYTHALVYALDAGIEVYPDLKRKLDALA